MRSGIPGPDRNDLGSGILYLGCGLAAVVLARDYGLGSALRMGPGYFPTVLGALLGVVGLAAIVRSFLRPAATDTDTAAAAATPGFAARKLIVILGALVLFGAIVRGAGVIVAVPVLVVVGASASDRFRWVPALALALGLTVFTVVVFIEGLGVPLPLVGSWFGSRSGS